LSGPANGWIRLHETVFDMKESGLDRGRITRSRFGSLLLHVFCCLVHQAREVTSRSGQAGASGFTALIGMSSRLDGPLHRWAMPSRGPTCLRVVRRGLSSAARTLARPWFGVRPGRAPTNFVRTKRRKASWVTWFSLTCAPTPCGATRSVSGGRHIGEVHWVGVAQRRLLFVGSGRHGRWRCRDQD